MRIGIDISQIVYQGTGVANYTKNLIENLSGIDKENKYIFFGGSLRRQQLLREYTNNVWPLPPKALDILWNHLHILPVENLIGKIQVFHSSDWTQPPTSAKKVTTIHDLVIYKFPESSHPTIIAAQKRRLAWVKKECDIIIVDSVATKNDCIEILNFDRNRLRVIYPGVGKEFFPQPREKVVSVLGKYGLEGGYVLAVGTREPRKNLGRVVEACDKIGAHLAIVGNFGWGEDNKILDREKVRLLGYVNSSDLAFLYSGAKCFVYPSLYEGFGLPVLEALACDCPVITSKSGSLPEVGGNAVSYVDPLDVDSLADKIKGVKKTGKELTQAQKFSWTKAASETLNVYKEVIGD